MKISFSNNKKITFYQLIELNMLSMALITIFSLQLTAQELKFTCLENGKIEIPLGIKEFKTENASYCYSLDPYALISKNCHESKNCLALQNIYIAPVRDTFGTPGSRICRKLKGESQVISFYTNKNEKIEFDRCYFKEDKSFVDMGHLYQHYTRNPLSK